MIDPGALGWDDLRTFLQVAHRGTLPEAARVLGISPATAGRRVQRLEEAVGAPLFDRLPNRLVLTHLGQELAEAGAAMQQGAAAMAQRANLRAAPADAPVRVTATGSVSLFLWWTGRAGHGSFADIGSSWHHFPMRIAVLADAHGNLSVLNAVLADMRTAAPDLVVNLGDVSTGPFDPAGSADAQMALGCPTVAGNHERNLLEGDDSSSSVAFARPLLSPAHLHWIASLPETLYLADDNVFACHGSPAGGDLDYLLDDVSSGRAVLASEDAIRPRLHGIGSASLVLCGHTHTPRAVQLGTVLVVNPGSIGMPAYTDDGAVPHAIETGAPHARYAIITRALGGTWSVELRAVAYDWDRAARQAAANGKPAVARWTATARA